VHYVTPTEDNQYQAGKMKAHGIFTEVTTEVGQIIVADVNHARIGELLAADRVKLGQLIRKAGDFHPAAWTPLEPSKATP